MILMHNHIGSLPWLEGVVVSAGVGSTDHLDPVTPTTGRGIRTATAVTRSGPGAVLLFRRRRDVQHFSV